MIIGRARRPHTASLFPLVTGEKQGNLRHTTTPLQFFGQLPQVVGVLQKAVDLKILLLHVIHAQSDRFIQHLVKCVCAAVVGKVLEHLDKQEERGGVYLADLHQHFGKAVCVVIGQLLYIIKLIDRRKLLPDNGCDEVYVFLVSVNRQPLLDIPAHKFGCGGIAFGCQLVKSSQRFNREVDGSFLACVFDMITSFFGISIYVKTAIIAARRLWPLYYGGIWLIMIILFEYAV